MNENQNVTAKEFERELFRNLSPSTKSSEKVRNRKADGTVDGPDTMEKIASTTTAVAKNDRALDVGIGATDDTDADKEIAKNSKVVANAGGGHCFVFVMGQYEYDTCGSCLVVADDMRDKAINFVTDLVWKEPKFVNGKSLEQYVTDDVWGDSLRFRGTTRHEYAQYLKTCMFGEGEIEVLARALDVCVKIYIDPEGDGELTLHGCYGKTTARVVRVLYTTGATMSMPGHYEWLRPADATAGDGGYDGDGVAIGLKIDGMSAAAAAKAAAEAKAAEIKAGDPEWLCPAEPEAAAGDGGHVIISLEIDSMRAAAAAKAAAEAEAAVMKEVEAVQKNVAALNLKAKKEKKKQAFEEKKKNDRREAQRVADKLFSDTKREKASKRPKDFETAGDCGGRNPMEAISHDYDMGQKYLAEDNPMENASKKAAALAYEKATKKAAALAYEKVIADCEANSVEGEREKREKREKRAMDRVKKKERKAAEAATAATAKAAAAKAIANAVNAPSETKASATQMSTEGTTQTSMAAIRKDILEVAKTMPQRGIPQNVAHERLNALFAGGMKKHDPLVVQAATKACLKAGMRRPGSGRVLKTKKQRKAAAEASAQAAAMVWRRRLRVLPRRGLPLVSRLTGPTATSH